MALLEDPKGMPWRAVWGFYCLQKGVRCGMSFIDEITTCERRMVSKHT